MRCWRALVVVALFLPLPSFAQQRDTPPKSCEEQLREAQLALSIADRTMDHQAATLQQASRDLRKEVVDAWGKALVRAEQAERALAQAKAAAVPSPAAAPTASTP